MTPAQPAEWAQVIDSTYESLRSLVLERTLSREPGLYAEAMLAYFQSDDSGMSRAQETTQNHDVHALISVRRELRARRRNPQVLQKALRDVSDASWAQGELLFLAGAWHEAEGEFSRSEAAFQESRVHYLKACAPRKALRSELNALAASTRLSPRRFLASRYLELRERARELSEQDIEAQCEALLSRAFQRLGCLSLARDHAERALSLSTEAFGSLQRQRIESHLALLLIQSGFKLQAETWTETLMHSEFSEIRAIASLLSAAHAGSHTLTDEIWENLPSSWRERWLEHISKDWSTTDLEGQLIGALAQRSRSIAELGSILYPDLQNRESSLARTREILRRVRKRWPGLVLRQDELYTLDSGFELPALPRALGKKE